MKGLVSVVIPVYNRAVFLGDAVQSVLAQSYGDFEILLVDDGSTDDTPERIADLCAASPDRVRSLRIENSGPGGAREAGRQAAGGEFIQYLDSDDRLLPGKFELQVAALRDHPDCGVAYGKTRLIDESGEILKAPFKRSGERHERLFPHLLVDRWWNTHTPLYRRELCDAIGPWTTMRMGEDWEYDARVGALGTRLAFCDEWVSEHRQHGGERLTGGELSPGALRDTGRLIPALWDSACRAGVKVGCPEMQHLSRWAFSVARQLGKAGESEAAAGCFEVARQADANGGAGRDFRLFGVLSRALGWRATGTLAYIAERFGRRRPSPQTLRQSWD